MKYTISFYLFFLSTLSYCADNGPSRLNTLDTIARKIVGPLATYTTLRRSVPYNWPNENFMDKIAFGLTVTQHRAWNNRFSYYLSDTQQKRIKNTDTAMDTCSSVKELCELRKKAGEHNTDAKCFNLAGNFTFVAALCFCTFSRIPRTGKALAFVPTVFFKYKAIKQTPLYDDKTSRIRQCKACRKRNHRN